jgi:Na+/melibiose symporter-like transporter
MTGFHKLYGSNPLHLLAHVGVFFVAGWAIDQIVGGGSVINWAAWFLGAALLHDLVLLPSYSALDRVLGRATRAGPASDRPPVINYIRVPAVVAGILLLVYFPLILGYSARNYRHDTGHALAGYTRNWLLICAGVFLVSAVLYAARTARQQRAEPDEPDAVDRLDD